MILELVSAEKQMLEFNSSEVLSGMFILQSAEQLKFQFISMISSTLQDCFFDHRATLPIAVQ